MLCVRRSPTTDCMPDHEPLALVFASSSTSAAWRSQRMHKLARQLRDSSTSPSRGWRRLGKLRPASYSLASRDRAGDAFESAPLKLTSARRHLLPRTTASPFRRSATEQLSASASLKRQAFRTARSPFSHDRIVWWVTPSRSASCLCVSPRRPWCVDLCTGKADSSTSRMISSFLEAGYLMRRRPHPPSRFFSANDLEGQLSHDLLQRAGLASQVLDLVGGRGPGRIASQSLLPGLEKV
jgi:hypothetical protein